MMHPPYVVGGLSMLVGFFNSMLRGLPQLDDAPLRAFIRAYQRRALFVGKGKAIEEIMAKAPMPVAVKAGP
jgi:hypothetical protein